MKERFVEPEIEVIRFSSNDSACVANVASNTDGFIVFGGRDVEEVSDK